jgi:hypothetical protein
MRHCLCFVNSLECHHRLFVCQCQPYIHFCDVTGRQSEYGIPQGSRSIQEFSNRFEVLDPKHVTKESTVTARLSITNSDSVNFYLYPVVSCGVQCCKSTVFNLCPCGHARVDSTPRALHLQLTEQGIRPHYLLD